MRYTRNRRVKYAALATAVGSVGMLGSVGTAFADTTAGPIGSLDVVTASAGSIWVAGWTIDPDTSASTTVQIYVDGTYAASASADLERDDVGAAYASYGSLHGFELSVDGLSTGTHTVAAYGIDTTGENDNSFLGSKSITIGGGTFGFVDVVTQAPGNTLRLAGWVIDPDSSDSTIVHVYIDGVFAAALDADRMRDDVADAYPGYGAEHGYDAALTGVASGTHTVAVYGIDVSGGQDNSLLGTSTVTVDGSPYGSLDVVSQSSDAVWVAGWAIDPDTADPITVHIYVDGTLVTGATASKSRTDIGAAFPSYGSEHGFSLLLTGLSTGTHTVEAYGINSSGGDNNSLLGRANLTVVAV